MVLTLDEWLPSGGMLNETLDAAVTAGLQARGLPPEFLRNYPFTLCSLHEFEATSKAMSEEGVLAVMGEKTAGEHQAWAMMPFLQRRFPRGAQGVGVLFEREWRGLTEGLQR